MLKHEHRRNHLLVPFRDADNVSLNIFIMNNEDIKDKPLKIMTRLGDSTGQLMPRGVQDILTIIIEDGYVVYYFRDSRITEKWAIHEKKTGKDTVYKERIKKAVRKYPLMNKLEIYNEIATYLKMLDPRVDVKIKEQL